MKRTLLGLAAALASMAVLTGAMLPLRGSLSSATTALILVVPVVIGVVIGGFAAGVLSVVAGFLVYDYFFLKPYLTLWVGAAQNWVALGVYVAVMLPVARVVAGLNTARARELRQGRELRQLFELSDLLVEDKPLDVLLSVIVTSLADVFGARQVALFLPAGPGGGRLELVGCAGEPLTEQQLRDMLPEPGSVTRHAQERSGLLVLALTASGRPVGLLALSADAAARHEREPLLLFANQIALAVERAQLREQALQTRVNEEMARLAKTLVAAVSHDLRAPLASIKASSSTLSDAELEIAPDARRHLAALIDVQADRLADLVQNLLDMSRIQAGVLTPRCTVTTLDKLVSAVVADPPPAWQGHDVRVELPDELPPIDVDLMLMSRVLTNLVDNAVRHSPAGAPVLIHAAAMMPSGGFSPAAAGGQASPAAAGGQASPVAAGGQASPAAAGGQASSVVPPAASRAPGVIKLSVTDHGPGVDRGRRDEIFELFARRDDDAGAGLGLTIAKTFVAAHGQRIWVEDAPGGGARFCFTLPVALSITEGPMTEEPQLAASSHHR